jgi:undecaprenyl-diphosphatase
MSILQSIFLGVVQGLTEFLPISSSGHLVFFQSLFGMKEPQLFFSIMVHFGTFMAVIIVFRRDISKIAHALPTLLEKERKDSYELRLLLWIILGTIPAGLMGILLRDWFESLFSKPGIVGGMLLITGLVLYLTRWTKKGEKTIEKMEWLDAILIGIAQGIAIIPGISRSGATISAGLFLGLNRELSGRFSFLLSIPAILGAVILETRKMGMAIEVWPSFLGMIVAFLVGLFSLTFLMKVIKMGKIFNFSYYCCGVGILMIIFS